MSQSLSVTYDSVKYDLSTIIIGDYFLSKTIYNIVAELSKNRNPYNTKTQIYADIIKENVKKNNLNTFVIFGLSINNDYHILKSIITNIVNSSNPNIIYCYYNPDDKDNFDKMYSRMNTGKINLTYFDSKEIINNIFH